jgi:hypothetical protein
MNDKQRIDWLEKQQGSALVSDDHSHWAVATFGMQNLPKKFPGDIDTSFFIKKKEWKKSIREAIDFAMKQDTTLKREIAIYQELMRSIDR